MPHGLTRPPARLLLPTGSTGQPGDHQTQELQALHSQQVSKSAASYRRASNFPTSGVLKHFLKKKKKKVVCFGDGILFSKAGVEAVGITVGKNKKDAFQAASFSLSCSTSLLPYKIPGTF